MWRRLLVLTGLAALVAWLLRRGRAGHAVAPSSSVDPSEELRRRLDEARRREEGAAAPPETDDPDSPADLEARRRDVHERARAAVDEMHGSAE